MGDTTVNVAAAERNPLRALTFRQGDLALCAFILFTASIRAVNGFGAARDGDILLTLNHTIVAIAMLINAVLCLMRGPAIARSRGWLIPVIAISGGYLANGVAILPMTWQPDWLIAGTTLLVTLSYTVIIWALLTLRRSFSVFPEARKLITHGPYRYIRHPLYAGYFVTYVCFALPRLSVWAIAVCAAGIGCEVWRALQEEKILRQNFPDYDAYAARTPRFLPRLAGFGSAAVKREPVG
ncbi:MAG: methyltransferase family protein [Thermomicrobiales bacterium]